MMANRPFFNKTFLDIYKGTARDYPPKDKQIYRAGSFLAGEHFNKENYTQVPTTLETDKCAGRVLRPDQQVTWECGGDLPKVFQTNVSGAVGQVEYIMDPFWSEVNDKGDVAVIDMNGLISLADPNSPAGLMPDAEDNICQGPYPPWIIYIVCDECGCSSGTIWLEDCSGDCCNTPCDPLPVLSGPTLIGLSTTGQFTLSDAQENVTWGISGGSGASIDDAGLVTTTGTACGTATVTATDNCCGDFTQAVRLGDATTSQWSLISSVNGGYSNSACPNGPGNGCDQSGNNTFDTIIGAERHTGFYRCYYNVCTVVPTGCSEVCKTCDGCQWNPTGSAPLDNPGIDIDCSSWVSSGLCFGALNNLVTYAWVCI